MIPHPKRVTLISVRVGCPPVCFSAVLILLLIVIAGAIGTFLGIITVVLKNERTTNRHQLLTNIPASVALGIVNGTLAIRRLFF